MSLSDTTINKKLISLALLLLRISIGLLMITHGWAKYKLLVSGEPVHFADPFNIGALPTLIFAVFAELVCASLLIVGLITRLATIPLIITMAVAVFVIHAGDGLAKQELGALYLLTFVALLLTGPGLFSLDRLIPKKKRYIFK